MNDKRKSLKKLFGFAKERISGVPVLAALLVTALFATSCFHTIPKRRLVLGKPTAIPAGIPPAEGGTEVIFYTLTGGTSTPPESVFLDEVDIKGNLIKKMNKKGKKVEAKGVAELKDDGKGVDKHAGDYAYTGTYYIESKVEGERYFRIRTEYKDKTVTSGVLTFAVTKFPLKVLLSKEGKLVEDPDNKQSRFLSNQVILKAEPGLASESIEKIASTVNGRVAGVIPALSMYLIELIDDAVPETAERVNNALEKINKLKGVKWATPNHELLYSGDPMFDPTDTPPLDTTKQWYLHKVNAPQSWALAGKGNPSYAVAVMDEGVKCDHPDLSSPSKCVVDDTADMVHGTEVAGIIAANANNDVDIAGVASETALYPVVANYVYNNVSTYFNDLNTEESNNGSEIKTINISFWWNQYSPDYLDDPVRHLACSGVSENRLLVIASGNNNDPNYAFKEPPLFNSAPPVTLHASLGGKWCGDYGLANDVFQRGILIVGGTDVNYNNAIVDATNYGVVEHTDIFAPGQDIVTTSGLSGTATVSGTSFAAPQVSGAAAILKAKNPSLTPQEIHDRIICKAPVRDITVNATTISKPFLDIAAAVGSPPVINVPTPITINNDCSDIDGPNIVVTTVTATDADILDLACAAVSVNETLTYSFVDPSDPTKELTTIDPLTIDQSTGDITYSGTCPVFAPNETFTVKVRDSLNLEDRGAFDLNVLSVDILPTFNSSIPDQVLFVDTATVALPFSINDDTPGSLNVTTASSNITLVPISNINITPVTGVDGSYTVTVTPAAQQTGTADITITVTDINSNSVTTTFRVEVQGPIIVYQPTPVDYNDAFGNPYTRYRIPVTNRAIIPQALFDTTGIYGPCGLNNTPSRTWVEIFNGVTNSRMYGFCALGTPNNLAGIWFAIPQGTSPPASVYIELLDRGNGGVRYRSNTVNIP